MIERKDNVRSGRYDEMKLHYFIWDSDIHKDNLTEL